MAYSKEALRQPRNTVGLEFQVFCFVKDYWRHLYLPLGWCGQGKTWAPY